MKKDKQIDMLLVEDNLDDTELTLYALTSANKRLHLEHFTNGEDALNFISQNKSYWGQSVNDGLKLIILDLKLQSKLGGLDIVKKIRREEKTKSIPIVILSSSRDHKDIHGAYELGVNSYVTKPDGFDGYVRKIGSLASYWSTVNERPS
ncbi:MAG: response regulator [Bacteroidetes bacterium]|nr:response regulator [Bacteroidota bacterium]MBI3483340.1 response regulator [Bacteroidota bacterium]